MNIKYYILATIFIFSHLSVVAQYFEPDEKAIYEYCEITESPILFKPFINIDIDYGQLTRNFNDRKLRDEEGNVMEFNSFVDAMNWMANDGWELVQAYIIPGDGSTKSWILKREKLIPNPANFKK